MPQESSMVKFKYGLQAGYNEIESKDLNTLYFTTDTQRLFVGETEYTRPIGHGSVLPEGYTPPNSLFVVEIGTARTLYYSKDGASWEKICALPGTVTGGVFGNNTTKTLNFGETFIVPKVTVSNDGFVTEGKDISLTLPAAPADIKNTVETSGSGNAVTSVSIGSDGHTFTVTKGETFATATELSAVQTTAAGALQRSGGTMTGNIVMDNNKITGLGTPTESTDASTKQYVDTQDAATLESAKEYADGLLGANDAMVFKGTVGEDGTVTDFSTLTDYQVGWTYRVITAGTYAGIVCEVGDLIIAVSDYSEQFKNSDWTVAQTNIDGAVISSTTLTSDHLVLGNGNKEIKVSTITETAISTTISTIGTLSSGKADKVSSATNGHLAGLDASGNLTDSGIVAADVATDSDLELKVDKTTTVNGQPLSGNVQITKVDEASTADKVANKLTINGQEYDGSSAISVTTPDTDTTYTFENGTDGTFKVTPSTGSEQTVSIGKPATAGNADTATKLATPRAISLSGDATGTANFDGSAPANIEVSVSHATAADTATSATKATQDGSGNVITNTYATKSEVQNATLKWGTF